MTKIAIGLTRVGTGVGRGLFGLLLYECIQNIISANKRVGSRFLSLGVGIRTAPNLELDCRDTLVGLYN